MELGSNERQRFNRKVAEERKTTVSRRERLRGFAAGGAAGMSACPAKRLEWAPRALRIGCMQLIRGANLAPEFGGLATCMLNNRKSAAWRLNLSCSLPAAWFVALHAFLVSLERVAGRRLNWGF
ncbi:MAG: hypothetical protein RL701_5141 [Pseudomonadota bacterium]|jgi:hypothetical protein